MSSMNRRQFSSIITLSGLGLVTIQLTGCGSSSNSDSQGAGDSSAVKEAAYGILVYDLLMYGYSNFSGDRLGQTGVLKATMIRDSNAVTLPYTQDGDGHKFNLTAADFESLKKGQKVEVNTTVAAGHTHKVVIDPKVKAPNAQSIEITDPSDLASGEKIFVSIEESDEPRLFVQGSKTLDPQSVEYCLDSKDACAADSNLWKKSKIHLESSERQVIVSDSTLTLDLNRQDIPLMVRGKLKENSKLVEAILKLTRKS